MSVDIAISTEMNLDRRKVIDITDANKDEFFKALLSDQPYIEEFSVLGGRLVLKLKTLTVEENADVSKQITLDKQAGVASDTDAYYITVQSYRLGLSLLSINGVPFSELTKQSYKGEDPSESYVAAKAKPFLSWSTTRLAAFMDVYGGFEAKILKLSTEVQNESFWAASA